MKLKGRVFIKQGYLRFRADKLTLYPLILAVFFIGASLLTLFFKASDLPLEVPLFYSLPWGEERLAGALMLTLLPISSLFILVFNLFWAAYFYEKEVLLSRILVVSSSFLSFLAFYTLVRIVFLIA